MTCLNQKVISLFIPILLQSGCNLHSHSSYLNLRENTVTPSQTTPLRNALN